MTRLIILAILLSVPSSALAMERNHQVFKQRLQKFISIALEDNPSLIEADNRIKAFKEVPEQAGSLDDPMLKLEMMNVPIDSFAFDQEPMTQKQIMIFFL